MISRCLKRAPRGDQVVAIGALVALSVALFMLLSAGPAAASTAFGTYPYEGVMGTCANTQTNCPEFPGNGIKSTRMAGSQFQNYYCGADSFTEWHCQWADYNPPPPPAATGSSYSGSTPYQTSKTFTPSTSNASGLTVLSQPTHGTASASGLSLTYTPAAGWSGSDSFTWRADGSGGNSSTLTASITTSAPPAPTITGTSVTTPYQTAKVVSPTVTNAASVAVVTAPAHGTAVPSGTSVTYTPASGYVGSDSFTVSASGVGGTSAPATISVTVSAPPLPTITGGPLSLAFNQSGAVYFNPTNGGVLQLQNPPTKGSVSISGGSATYTPNPDYIGSDSFSVIATNPGGSSSPQTVAVTVAPPPPPTVSGGSLHLAFNGSGAHNFAPTSGGVVSLIAQPAHGTATLSGGQVTYTPNPDYIGADSFAVTATNLGGTSAPATVNVTVDPPPIPTIAGGSLRLVFNQGGSHDFAPTDGGELTISSPPSHGAAVIVGGRANYVPNGDYIGPDSFSVTATNLGGTSAPATVNVTVDPPPIPSVVGGSLHLAFNGAAEHDFAPTDSGVLAISTQPTHGAVAINGRRVQYTPNPDYIGTDSFAATATNLGGTSAPAMVSVTVDPPPIPAIAGVSLSTAFNAPITYTFQPSDRGVVAIASQPAHGTATVAGNSVTYTPAQDFMGGDSLMVTATNLGGTSAPVALQITVVPPNAPVAASASLTTGFEASGAVNLTVTGLYNSVAITAQPAHGTVALSGLTATYTPVPGYYGPDAFTYEATGFGGSSGPATVTVEVQRPPAPLAAALTLALPYNAEGSVQLTATGVFSTFQIVQQPDHGAATLTGDTVHYVAAAGYYGPDTFEYVANGPGGDSARAAVSVTVELPGVPAVNALTLAVPYGAKGEVQLVASGVYSGFRVAQQPKHGIATLVDDKVGYAPAGGFFGTDTFTYVANGPGGDSAPATVTVTVATPDAPVVTPPEKTAATTTGAPVIFSLRAAGEASVFVVARAPNKGMAAIADATATYTPNKGAQGEDSFAVVARGPGGDSAPTEFKVTIAAAPTEPTKPSAADVTAEVQQGTEIRVKVTAQLVGGPFEAVELVEQPPQGQARVEGLEVVYSAPADFAGSVSMKYAVKVAGQLSDPAKLTVTVHVAPKVPPKQATATTGDPALVNLTAGAEGGPFTTASVISVSPASAGTAKILNGEAVRTALSVKAAKSSSDTPKAPAVVEEGEWYLSFEGNPDFNGTAKVQVSLVTASGANALGEVTVQVRNLPNPSRDRGVTALVAAQTQAATRFGTAQVTNVNRRLEALHDERGGRNNLSLSAVGASQPLAESEPGYDPIRERQRAAMVPEREGMAEEADTPARGEEYAGGAKVWATGAIQFGRAKQSGAQSFDFTTNGVSAGADVKLTDGVVVGAGAGYGRDVSELSGDLGKVDSQSASIFAYGSFRPAEQLFIDGVVGIATLDFKTKRAIVANGNEVRGDRTGDQLFGSLSASWDYARHGLRMAPYGRLEYVRSTLAGFAEKGDPTFGLAFAKQAVEELSLTGGLRGEYAYRFRGGTLVPLLRTEVKQVLSETGVAQVSYAPLADGPAYRIDGTINGSTSILGGVGLMWRGINGWDFSLDLDHSAVGSGTGVTTVRVGGSGKF